MSPRFASISVSKKLLRSTKLAASPAFNGGVPFTPSSFKLPDDIPRPPYARIPPMAYSNSSVVKVHTDPVFIDKMRKAGEIAATILDALGKACTPGISTSDLNDFAMAHCAKHKVYPSPLGYQNYPAAICTSVNEVVCHGVPNQNVLNDGDIITVDVTIFRDGVHADCASTFLVGHGTPPEAVKVTDAARAAAACAAASCVEGASLSAVALIVDMVAEKFECSVLPTICGHGIGENFHEAPQVAHTMKILTKKSIAKLPRLRNGMILTVEPAIATKGCSGKIVIDPRDGWTVRTEDGSFSAQFEHTVLVTEKGPEILTALP